MRRDAILYAVGANDAHGLPRNNADKRKAVQMLLDDAEWSAKSNVWIAEQCKVSESFVRSMKPDSGAHETHLKVMGKDGKLQSAKKSDEQADNADACQPNRRAFNLTPNLKT